MVFDSCFWFYTESCSAIIHFLAGECTLPNDFKIGLVPGSNCSEVYYYQNMDTDPLLLSCTAPATIVNLDDCDCKSLETTSCAVP